MLLIIFILIAISGILSAAEIALTSLTKAKTYTFENDQKFASRAIIKIKQKPRRLLITILVSNQVVNILATSLATLWAVEQFGENKIGVVMLFFTIALILFGSIAPKTFALGFSEAISRIAAYPLLIFIYISRPITWVFEKIIEMMGKILRVKENKLIQINPEEIEAMVKIGSEEGVLEEFEEMFLKHAIRLSKSKIEPAMVKLKDIQALNINTKQEEIIQFLESNQSNEYPIYEEDLNNIKGTVSFYELAKILRTRKYKYPLKSIKIKPNLVIPKTATYAQLFKVFTEKNKRTAIVIDEYGQTIGLISINILLKQITGMNLDNQKVENPEIKKQKRNSWEADGLLTIEKLNEALGIKMLQAEHKTLGLIILEELNRFPEIEEIISFKEIEIQIKKIEKNVIKKVEIRKIIKKKR